MFTKILIANRGEIACRVAATARRLGIRTVAVYSDADANAKHVAVCDEAVRLGPAPARDSYLRADRIAEIAIETGAQAVHPGYGFLSENDAFAEACAAAGIVFIGPPAAAIRAMGSKSAAKALMQAAGVPLVPGYHGDNQDPAFLRAASDEMGYPVLIKASAGGGGKGMRVVERSADFESALASCQREAKASFGDDRVLVEKYLTRPRHIEIQVFADTHGHCVYLFERDCSVQRRHQKVLEEAPAPGMSDARRRAMGEAAVAAAQAVGYVGAGTVEFIVEDAGGRDGQAGGEGAFYFMEMNTRLQVEHPVTEMITGFDLVEWQLRVAAGGVLPRTQAQLRINGHAIEARIYAENPDKGFLPATGTLRHLRLPDAVEFELGLAAMRSASSSPMRPGGGAARLLTPAAVRIDSGIRAGDSITPFYDPMIAKLIVWGATRDEALARMSAALAQTEIVGVATNVAFLARVIASPAFAGADLDTGLIERHRDLLLPPPPPSGERILALAAAAVLQRDLDRAGTDPWSSGDSWRMNMDSVRPLNFSSTAGDDTVALHYRRGGVWFEHGKHHATLNVNAGPDGALRVLLGTDVVAGRVIVDGEQFHVFYAGRHVTLTLADELAHAGEGEAELGNLSAPMPGKVVAVLVARGTHVKKGTPLLVMEAMKMEHTIAAPASGMVDEILYGIGDQVTEGAQLLAFSADGAGVAAAAAA